MNWVPFDNKNPHDDFVSGGFLAGWVGIILNYLGSFTILNFDLTKI